MKENCEPRVEQAERAKERTILRARDFFLGSLLLLICAALGSAQTGEQGSIEGMVTDPSGAVISGAELTVRNLATTATFTARTNEDGLFRFLILPLGKYELSVASAGFAKLNVDSVIVTEGARINLPLSLHLAGTSESVVVTGQAPIVEATRSQVSTTVDERAITDLPVNGRVFANLVLLTPGVTRDVRGGLSFAGQRAGNVMMIDGVDDNDPYFDQPLAGGFARDDRGGYQFSQAAVQEFQVNSNAYSAELGRAGGGVVSAVTKSGTNHFHGSVFWFYRDKSLNANDPVNKLNGKPKAPYHLNQLGGTLGGPIVRNKLFFFANYEALRSTVPNTVVLNLPAGFRVSSDPQQRAVDYLRARADSWTLPFVQDVYLTKFDWQVAPSHLVTGRWNRQRLGNGILGLGPQTSLESATVNRQDTDALAFTLTSTVSASKVNVARFNYLRLDAPWIVQSTNPGATIKEGGQTVLKVGQAVDRFIGVRRGEWSDTITYLRGRHALRFGGDVIANRIVNSFSLNFFGSYIFNSLESFGRSLAGAPVPQTDDQYTQAFSGDGRRGSTAHPNFSEFAGFAQDEWRVGRSVTLNLGLRYDLQLMAQPTVKNPSAALAAAGLDTSLIREDKRDFAPRLGLAWTPFRNQRLVVRGGYGIFYGSTPAVIIANAHFQNGITVQTRIFKGNDPSGALIPSYPNSLCGPPDPASASSSCAAPAAGAGKPILLFFAPDYRQPYTQQGSVGIEAQLEKDLSLTVSYLLVRGTHLQRVRDVNLGTPTTPTTVGIASTSATLVYQKFTQPRPMPDFDRVLTYHSDANSIYHGLTVQINKRLSHNVQLLGAYTFGKVIDDAPNVYYTSTPDDASLVSDSTNPRVDHSAGVNDQRHRLSLSGVWGLNYGKNLPKLARSIFGGWQVSGILTAQSGQPYSAMVNFDLNNDGNLLNDRTPGLGRNTFYAPHTVSLDPRLTRSLRLNERATLLLAWEAFNVFNRANILNVKTTQYAFPGNPAACGIAGTPCLVPQNKGLAAFGTPLTSSGARIMQLSARLVF